MKTSDEKYHRNLMLSLLDSAFYSVSDENV